MNQELSLAAYSDDPVYNMKAVTQHTGIPAATLRAWERRHQVLDPRRTSGNYRLYSERDLAILAWLKTQLDAGLSISRAAAMLDRLKAEQASRPDRPAESALSARDSQPDPARSLDYLRGALHRALVAMDEPGANAVMAEASALYPIESVSTGVITPCMVHIGQDWHAGRIGVVAEHFATAFLLGRLLALFGALPAGRGPLALVGCAPGDRHEMGALLVALFLRRRGRNVRYLGADVPLADLVSAIRDWRPQVVVISVTMPDAALRLEELPRLLASSGVSCRFVFGGRALSPENGPVIGLQGSIFSDDIHAGVAEIERLLG
jgi:DNA-binding transcriptional MerR regulator/methylmalonyl-CoA mutase cobalamin-binding subunit